MYSGFSWKQIVDNVRDEVDTYGVSGVKSSAMMLFITRALKIKDTNNIPTEDDIAYAIKTGDDIGHICGAILFGRRYTSVNDVALAHKPLEESLKQVKFCLDHKLLSGAVSWAIRCQVLTSDGISGPEEQRATHVRSVLAALFQCFYKIITEHEIDQKYTTGNDANDLDTIIAYEIMVVMKSQTMSLLSKARDPSIITNLLAPVIPILETLQQQSSRVHKHAILFFLKSFSPIQVLSTILKLPALTSALLLTSAHFLSLESSSADCTELWSVCRRLIAMISLSDSCVGQTNLEADGHLASLLSALGRPGAEARACIVTAAREVAAGLVAGGSGCQSCRAAASPPGPSQPSPLTSPALLHSSRV